MLCTSGFVDDMIGHGKCDARVLKLNHQGAARIQYECDIRIVGLHSASADECCSERKTA